MQRLFIKWKKNCKIWKGIFKVTNYGIHNHFAFNPHRICNLKSWEEFEMYIKRYKVFERAALKFKKELIIESKKLELENDFNADDD